MKGIIFSTFFLKVASAVFSFTVVIMLSQVLGAEGRGEASIILTTLSIVLIFSEFSGGGSLIYLIPRNNIKSLLATSYVWSLGVSLISCAVLYSFLLVREEYIVHIVVIAFVLSVGGANIRVLVAKERLGKSNLIQFLQVFIVFLTLILLFFLFKNKNIGSYIIALYVSATIVCFLSFSFIIKDVLNEKDIPFQFLFNKTLRFGSKNQAAHITQFVSYRASYYIIERFWGMGLVGIYSNGVSIAESVWLFSRSIALVQLSKITNSQDDQQNRSLTIQLTKYTVLVTLVLLVPLLFLPGSFYVFLFGPEFLELPGIIFTLTPGIVLFSIALIIGHYFSGNGKYEINAIASAVGLVVTLTMGFILIPHFSIWGAGITASVSYFSTAFIVMFVFFKRDKKSWTRILPKQSDLTFFFDKIRKKLE